MSTVEEHINQARWALADQQGRKNVDDRVRRSIEALATALEHLLDHQHDTFDGRTGTYGSTSDPRFRQEHNSTQPPPSGEPEHG